MTVNKRLFVGSLPYDTTQEQLEEIFSAVGKVVATKVIMDKFTGQSKGFGFVEMGTEEDALKAIQTLNGSKLGRRDIIVSEARPKVQA